MSYEDDLLADDDYAWAKEGRYCASCGANKAFGGDCMCAAPARQSADEVLQEQFRTALLTSSRDGVQRFADQHAAQLAEYFKEIFRYHGPQDTIKKLLQEVLRLSASEPAAIDRFKWLLEFSFRMFRSTDDRRCILVSVAREILSMTPRNSAVLRYVIEDFQGTVCQAVYLHQEDILTTKPLSWSWMYDEQLFAYAYDAGAAYLLKPKTVTEFLLPELVALPHRQRTRSRITKDMAFQRIKFLWSRQRSIRGLPTYLHFLKWLTKAEIAELLSTVYHVQLKTSKTKAVLLERLLEEARGPQQADQTIS